MGALSPVAGLDDAFLLECLRTIHEPVLAELARRGTPFRGALYAGLMLTADGPRLLEFNARFGDPETQAILPRLDVPLAPLLLGAATGRLAETAAALGVDRPLLPVSDGAAVAVVLAAPGYPASPEAGAVVEGLDEAVACGALVFGAGLGRDDRGRLVTAGGRVVTVVGRGRGVGEAADAAYAAAERVRFAGRQLRSDIGRERPVLAGVGAAS
jgi:phosphoribosylamine--glycine ligase